ncbi:hypothetical protein Cgig2_008555 [Carnegiea gigantea]|uniref:Uncharacterized protein n=1 Tax=Carnegiea gigantea TaxID=171969 RepID=A0A9Q1GVL6_9CARY|nr:hypothetical protein Cgig2_008555 [Carnegiea gigantea]
MDVWLQDIDERLRDAYVPRLIEILANPQPLVSPEETSRRRGTPPARRMAKMKSTPHVRTLDELLVEEALKGHICSASSPQRLRIEILSANSRSSSVGTSPSSSSDGASTDSSFDGSSSRSSLGEALISSSTPADPNAPGRVVHKKRGCASIGTVPDVVAEGLVFPGAASRADS